MEFKLDLQCKNSLLDEISHMQTQKNPVNVGIHYNICVDDMNTFFSP